MTTSNRSTQFQRYLENFNHHVYAAYSERNATEVRLVLEHLRKAKLRVYDPAAERKPGKSIFHKWLQNGIHKSRVTLLFWSKEFKKDVLCAYQCENAVMRTVLTKGRHTVLCVVMDNSKIPKLFKKFDCIYAWNWKTKPTKTLENIRNSLLARLECSQPYQYGQRQTGATQKIPSCQYIRGSSRLSVARNVNVLLNFQRIKTVLDHCILSCQNHGCRFSCYGENIKAFYAHVNDCRFAHVPCPNRTCRQRILRARSVRHKVKCRYKLTKCLNDGCGREFTRREYKMHKRTCRYVHIRCPNYKYSCKHVFRFKDTKAHLKICKYQSLDCNLCGEKVFRVEMEGHKIKSCPNGLVSCSGCSIMVKRMNLEKHQEVCLQYIQENHGSTKEFVNKPIQDLVPQDMPTSTESKHRSVGMDTMSASATDMRERYLQKCFYNSLPVTKADKQRHVGCQGQTRDDPGSSVLQSDNKWIASQTQSNTDSFRRGLGRDLEEHGPTSFATEATDLLESQCSSPNSPKESEDKGDSGFLSMMQKALNEVKKKVRPPDKPPVNNSRQNTQEEPLECSKFRHVNPFSRQMSKDKLKLVDTYIDADNGVFSKAEPESRQVDRERKNSIPKKKQPHIEQFPNTGESKLNFIEKLIKSKK